MRMAVCSQELYKYWSVRLFAGKNETYSGFLAKELQRVENECVSKKKKKKKKKKQG